MEVLATDGVDSVAIFAEGTFSVRCLFTRLEFYGGARILQFVIELKSPIGISKF